MVFISRQSFWLYPMFRFLFSFLFDSLWDALGLGCCVWAFSSRWKQGLLSSCDAWASHHAGFSWCRAQPLGCAGFNSCGTQAWLPLGMWDLSGPEIKPVFPALQGRFLITGPLRKAQLFFSHSSTSNSLQPRGQPHARLPCPSPCPGACSNSCPLSQWCHPPILPSIILISSCLQCFPASGSFLMSWLFASGGQSIGASASASVPLMNIQDWFPLGLTGLISLQSKVLWRIFSSTTAQKHQFFSIQPSLWSNSHIHIWLPEKPKLWL